MVASHLLRMAIHIVRDMHHYLRQHHADVRITMPQLRVLRLAHLEHPTLSDVAQALRVTRPTATRLVDGLVERGWLERTPDPHDRRRIRLKTTDAGLAVCKKVEAALSQHFAARLASLDAEGLDLLEQCLASVEQAWEWPVDIFSDV